MRSLRIAAVVAAIALVGCTGDDTAGTPQSSVAPTPPTAPRTFEVSGIGYAFDAEGSDGVQLCFGALVGPIGSQYPDGCVGPVLLGFESMAGATTAADGSFQLVEVRGTLDPAAGTLQVSQQAATDNPPAPHVVSGDRLGECAGAPLPADAQGWVTSHSPAVGHLPAGLYELAPDFHRASVAFVSPDSVRYFCSNGVDLRRIGEVVEFLVEEERPHSDPGQP
jgi:hypothetical protein